MVFQYIVMLQKAPSKLESFIAESRHLSDLAFFYRQKTESRAFTSSTAKRMQTQVPPKWYIGIGGRSKEFDEPLLAKALNRLQPSKAQIMLISQKYPGTWEHKEKWYSTEYTQEPLPDQFLAELQAIIDSGETPAELHLPEKNPFIPTNLDIDTSAKTFATPRLLKDSPLIRSWHKKDDTFLVPKAHITVSLQNPALFASATNESHASLFTELVTDVLQTYAYAASLAGLYYSVSTNSRGLVVRVSGYNDKLPVLLDRVLDTVLRLGGDDGYDGIEIRGDRLEILRERLLRGCRNSDLRKPCLQIPSYEPWLLSADAPSASPQRLVRELVPGLEGATVESMRAFREQCLKRLHVEMYSHGNLTRSEAESITGIVEKHIDGKSAAAASPQPGHATVPPDVAADQPSRSKEQASFSRLEVLLPRALIIPSGANLRYTETIRDTADVNNCISYFLQLGPPSALSFSTSQRSAPNGSRENTETTSMRTLRARTQLICHILRPRVFHQLRTTEQLGYVVRTRMSASPGAPGSRTCGFAIEVQSEKTPEHLEARIDAFLDTIAGSSAGQAGIANTGGANKESILGRMSDAEFEAEKKGVVDKMLEKPKNMTQENDVFWARIRDERYDFEQGTSLVQKPLPLILLQPRMLTSTSFLSDTAQKDAKHVLALTKDDLADFIRFRVVPGSEHRSSLVIYLRSHKHAPGSEEVIASIASRRTEITDVRDFKASLIADIGPRPVQDLETFLYQNAME